MTENGFLVISLDFELVWGVFDVVGVDEKIYFKNTRKVVPRILEIFEGEEIHCTWATVGMLFNRNWEEWLENIPEKLPGYHNTRLSAYDYGKKMRFQEQESFSHFAPDLIEAIITTPGQELGTHTYSHYYCQEQGQREEEFEDDLKNAVEMARKSGFHLKTLVFPRNQYKQEYLEICSRLGITSVRTNPKVWYWEDPSSKSFFTKLFRTGDAYNLLAKSKSYPISELRRSEDLPIEQRSSRFLRPYEENAILRKLKLQRIKREMTAAAKRKEIYHLWWHPHNFGNHPEESLTDLMQILKHFKKLKSKYGFTSVHMGEVAEMVLK